MREAEPLCAENIGLKDIARSRREELISRGELIMYCSPPPREISSGQRFWATKMCLRASKIFKMSVWSPDWASHFLKDKF